MNANIIEVLNLIKMPHDIRVNGSCGSAGVDPDFFFSDDEAEISLAKAVCFDCPVRSQCLDRALQVEEFGVWGGTTPEERDVMRDGSNVVRIEEVNANVEHARYLYSASAEEIAEQTGKNVRTIQRWRAEMHDLGYAS